MKAQDISSRDYVRMFYLKVAGKQTLGKKLTQNERVFEVLFNAKEPVPCHYFSTMSPRILMYTTRIYELKHGWGIPIKNKVEIVGGERHGYYWIEGFTNV